MSAQSAPPVERLRQLRAQAQAREADEIIDGRLYVATYYTGVMNALDRAIDELEGGAR